MNKKGRRAPSRRAKKFVIVGDWFVDEHWVTGIHRSPTSSRTGQRHSRALHLSESTVEALCGAGQVASVLHQAQMNDAPVCEIVGIGSWHHEDQRTLEAMLNPWYCEGHTPHRVSCPPSTPAVRAKLLNLGEALQPDLAHGTTRVIRIYQQTGARVDLIQRIDWELRLPPLEDAWTGKSAEKLEHFRPALADADAVFIKDTGRGVIFSGFLKWLARQVGEDVPWMISSKTWDPSWFRALPENCVRLLLFPQAAAAMAIRVGRLNSWLTTPGFATKNALAVMDEFAARFPKAIVVALPGALSVVTRSREVGLAVKGLAQTCPGHQSLASSVPMASVFFPALGAELLCGGDRDLHHRLHRALRFTSTWMQTEGKRIEDPERWKPGQEQVLRLDADQPQASWESWRTFDWSEEKREWESAFSGIGVIERTSVYDTRPSSRIELWRSMTEVDGYVCCVKSKRAILQLLVRELAEGKTRRQNRSYMLVASPGSGKTYLIRRLAKALDMRFLPFNITQMLSREDILDCFDTIVTTQAQNKDEMVLVFVDEINARLDGEHVYDAFLAPIELGQFVRGGKTFYIDPCAWVFAGTERPVRPGGEAHQDRTDKGSDFESRLSREPLDFKINKDNLAEVAEAQVEKVYLGVALLRSVFPDVRKVSQKVLQVFHMLPVHLGARDVERFVRSFSDIQYGVVLSKNVPAGWFEESLLDAWSKEEEGPEIEIVG